MRRPGVARAVIYGTLAVGTLDILDAFIFFGPLYGIAAYVVVNVIVVPASRIGGSFTLVFTPALVNGLLIHVFGVGLPSALAAAAAAEPPTEGARRG